MRRIVPAAILLLAGCQDLVGPRQRGPLPPGAVANPCLTIPEQQRRGRSLLALPEASPVVAPPTFAEQPALRGDRR
jgi:hypothetical protein